MRLRALRTHTPVLGAGRGGEATLIDAEQLGVTLDRAQDGTVTMTGPHIPWGLPIAIERSNVAWWVAYPPEPAPKGRR
jgi:hypothetical protein